MVGTKPTNADVRVLKLAMANNLNKPLTLDDLKKLIDFSGTVLEDKVLRVENESISILFIPVSRLQQQASQKVLILTRFCPRRTRTKSSFRILESRFRVKHATVSSNSVSNLKENQVSLFSIPSSQQSNNNTVTPFSGVSSLMTSSRVVPANKTSEVSLFSNMNSSAPAKLRP